MEKKQVLVCIDGSSYDKAACSYGVFIAKMLNVPLLLLNVIEHNYQTQNVNLAGNIGLGSKDKLLEELSNYEHEQSRTNILLGRKVLEELKEFAKEQGASTIQTLQRHGTLEETLQELSSKTKIAIIALKKQDANSDSAVISSHVKTVIRTLSIPVLLVNSKFKPIDSMLMAYDGSDFANKAISVGIKEPIFPNAIRHIVNVNKDESSSYNLLARAKKLFTELNIEVETAWLKGNEVEKLLEYQERHKLDIIAMGAFSHNQLRSAIFGSFTSKMLLKAKKPLLLFR